MNVIKDNEYIVGVILSSELKTIGDSAFASCDSLASVVISSGVTSIGGNAFFECNSLASVTFAGGSSITSGNFAAGSTSFPIFPGDLRDKWDFCGQ
ncbi:MAG: leucine-rich repeat domain-containing protein [Treponema sp.]|jgi:hypothetical protein|nr:leucine-rich repeat domain-containing protein [Treponema sp.]